MNFPTEPLAYVKTSVLDRQRKRHLRSSAAEGCPLGNLRTTFSTYGELGCTIDREIINQRSSFKQLIRQDIHTRLSKSLRQEPSQKKDN